MYTVSHTFICKYMYIIIIFPRVCEQDTILCVSVNTIVMIIELEIKGLPKDYLVPKTWPLSVSLFICLYHLT